MPDKTNRKYFLMGAGETEPELKSLERQQEGVSYNDLMQEKVVQFLLPIRTKTKNNSLEKYAQ